MGAKAKDAESSFEAHRAHLTGLAYRMLGSLAEAQDVVQDSYLRWHQARAREQVEDLRAFLSKTVTRLCLDHLKSARARRELYLGPWLPEPVFDHEALAAKAPSEYASDVSVALMLTLERLSPLERAAFLLHDVFDVGFDEVAGILDRKAASCRQLAARARARVRASRPRFRVSPQQCERLAAAFGAAVQNGDAHAIAALLARDAVFYSDGGGKVVAALRPIRGRNRIARLLASLSRKTPVSDRGLRPSRINGLPGFMVELQTGAIATVAMNFGDDLIASIYLVINPDKLRHVRPNQVDASSGGAEPGNPGSV
ncbi:MAG: RNA polymerase sigma factor SigJ [Deltaproteobacteria bacterium]|jgi:RNA polymerase sigma-70 factor (ECF subfamily)|nr:RNA polymerase sigma factor SigJ [Deltaproteobacteria bacterium]